MEKKKVLIILHGLGDHIVLFPVLYDYYLQHNKKKLYLVVLDNGAKDFWDTINFVEKTFIINPGGQPHYWNAPKFFLRDYPRCMNLAREVLAANKIDNYESILLKGSLIPNILDKTIFESVDRHKIANAYNELNIRPENIYTHLSLESFFKKSYDTKKIEEFFKENSIKKNDYILIHRKSFYDKKNIKKEKIEKLAREFSDKKFVIIMDQQMNKDEIENEGGQIILKNVIYTTKYNFSIIDIYFLLKYARCSIVIDSSIMHLSQFVFTPTLVVFKTKFSPKRIVPFAGNIMYKETKDEKLESFIFQEFIHSHIKS